MRADQSFEGEYPEFVQGEILEPENIRRYFGFLGQGVKIFRGCRIVPSERVSVGDYSQIDEKVMIFAGGGVEIGRHVHLATCSTISGGGECEIQDFVGVGVGCRIITGTEEPMRGGLTNPTVPGELRSVSRSRVILGRHSLVFTNAIILPGVEVGEGAVVSAGAVVHKSLMPWTIYAGSPLVAIGRRDRDSVLAAEEKLKSTDG